MDIECVSEMVGTAADLIEKLIDRCARYAEEIAVLQERTRWVPVEERLPENPSPAQIEAALSKEADAVRARLPQGCLLIALCVEGKLCSSEELAAFLAESAVRGGSHVVFLIGSSFGLHPSLKALAAKRLSLSPMTFPHHLARVMLLEQIYRAYQINSGSRYHK